MTATPKTVIVSGGATSIGADITRAFARTGAGVVIADIAETEGSALACTLGSNSLFVRTDLAVDTDIDACVARAVEAFGGVDSVVHAACSYVDGGAAASREDWHRSLDVNLVGAARLASAAVAPMRARGGGAIVLIGSISAKVAQAGRWLYPASKAALLQLARSMALDLAPYNIRVNSLSPGKTWSAPLSRKHGGDRSKADRLEAPYHMLGRLAHGEEIAAAALFLCSAEASFITGTDLAVDGGYSAMGPERSEVHR